MLVLVLVLPAAWRAQFPCTRIGCIPHEVQGHTRTRAGRAAYVTCAGSHTTGCRLPHPPPRLFCGSRETRHSGGFTNTITKPKMSTTPRTSDLDCKIDQIKALLNAALHLTGASVPLDMETVRGVLYAAQDAAQTAGAITERLEFEYRVVPA